jgi:hypothetical protein
VGELIWEQKRVPLNLPIEKAEGIQLGGWHTLLIDSHLDAAKPENEKPEQDWFGVGTFLNLNDSQALNNGRFEQQQSGLRIGVDAVSEGEKIEAKIEIALVKLPTRIKFDGFFTISQYANAALSSLLGERTSGAQLTAGKAGVSVAQEKWNHHGGDGKLQNVQPLNAVQAFVQTKQYGGIALPSTEKALDLTGVF